MSRKPLVSIVIPARNRASLLQRAVGSICAQTVRDLEIVIVDDASDQDLQISVVVPLRIVKNARQVGAQQSRLVGAIATTGRYVALLDSDDWWAPEKLERQIAILEAGLADLVSCRVVAVRGSFRKSAPRRPISPDERVEDFLYVERGMLQTSTIVTDRRLMIELLQSTASAQVHNDTMIFIEAQRRELRIVQLSDPLSFFDDNPRTDRVSYDIGRVEASEAWFRTVSHRWSPAARRGFILTDMVTRRVNTGKRWDALKLLLRSYHPAIDLGDYLKRLAFVICNGPPLRFFRSRRSP